MGTCFMRVFIHRMFLPPGTNVSEFDIDLENDQPLREVLAKIGADHGFGIEKMIDETSTFRPHIAVFYGDERQREPDRSSVPADLEEISIFPALSGG